MAVHETIKPVYRRLRRNFGWAIVALWLVYRWISLSMERNAALRALNGCEGFFARAGCDTQAAGYHFSFTLSMIGSVLLAPLAFLIAHFIARAMAEHHGAEQLRIRDEAVAARVQRDDAEQRARTENAQQHAQRARLGTQRSEFLNSLGSVNDYLDMLGVIAGDENTLRIKQGIGKELRDLVAKYAVADLEQLIATDEAIRIGLTSTLDRVEAAGVAGDAAAVLRRAAEPHPAASRSIAL
jgi:hypothetical protein